MQDQEKNAINGVKNISLVAGLKRKGNVFYGCCKLLPVSGKEARANNIQTCLVKNDNQIFIGTANQNISNRF